MKRFLSIITAFSIMASAFSTQMLSVFADDELPTIKCTQSVSFTNNGSDFTLNTLDVETPSNVYWNNTSGDYKGVAVLEFILPATEADLIKSVELTYTIHNGSSRSGGRTYSMYGSNIDINESTTADTVKTINLSSAIYSGAAVNQGQTRIDKVNDDVVKDYVKSKANASSESKVQFAFSNSSQALDIDPTTAELSIVMYGGGIALDKHEITVLSDSEPTQLTPSVFESGISESDLIWESMDDEIVTVENGLVTPLKAGKTIVKVRTSDNSFSDECNVTVLQATENITFDKSTLNTIADGIKGEITVKFSPENAVNRTLVWTSDNGNVATVSQNGIIIPKGVGTATITAVVKDTDIKDQCVVTVGEAATPESITLNEEEISIPKLGSTFSLKADITPQNADSHITWTSTDENIARVYDGVIVAGEVGNTVITAKTANGITAQCSVTVTDDDKLITNDYFYKDTDGNPIYSQGGGIFKFGDTYYWYGVRYAEAEAYFANPLNGANVEHPVFEAYTCYTSKDLTNWKYEGDVATLATLGQSWCGWAGRCGVVYNEKANKYVLVSQFNGTIIASADNPLGPFKTEKGYFWGGESLPVIANGDTGDLTMFYDEDGSAYMICSSANGRGHLYVVPMRESDYCDFDFDKIKEIGGSTGQYFDEDGSIQTKDKGGIEGDCMFKYRDRYYFTGSDLYGWHGSRVYVFQADNILGDYNLKADYNISDSNMSKQLPCIMENVKNSYAHNSQTGFYYTLHGTKQDLVIYCGDRWSSFCSNGLGFNQWNPLTMNGYTPHFNNLSQWRLNAETGEWSIGDGNNYISNSDFDADRVDLNNLTGWECSDNVGGIATGNVKSKRVSGKYSARQSADMDYIATMKQSVKDLPDGNYTLRASVKSSGGQNECKLYAKTDEKEYYTSLKSQMNDWTDVVIKDIEVQNGECEIGLFSDAYSGNYVRIDDLFLTRDYDGTVIAGKPNTNVPNDSYIEFSNELNQNIDTLKPNEQIHARAFLYNSDAVDGNLYMSLYKNNVLFDIKSAKIGSDGFAETDSITLPDNVDNMSVKLFLWDNNLTSLYEKLTFGK